MAKKTQVKVKNNGYTELMRFARRVKGGSLAVGVLPSASRVRYSDSGQTVAQVASWHETGTTTPSGAVKMQARPFLTFWFTRENGARRLRDATREALDWGIRTGKDPTPRLRKAGERYVAQIRETFNLMAPLAPSTVRQKGSRRKLYRTGALFRAINYKVEIKKL